ncbi:hypothetical protein GGP41_006081 [Bipolaris sorokiniana]|uniref:Opioid growth factor receptor (OGFr) conserved domain-containing protein n=2 Tax=Cochliobolus sativus TaxID=45130 RepID=A0A8H6DUR4_COCSA|nr:uncharacterized protein COCSADRAFT_41742 [Bipolaris sorokiniana ND90Pr]EMD58627.1 hypothetical protein COCSADRAFT_41742 [Bipolaris sorokiniana ND90Pr]KAF5849151.1 hypothetical protein GGP41_006081 [Bipolaris sorokiniana]
MERTPDDKAHKGESAANTNSCHTLQTLSSVQSQPTVLTPTSISQLGAVQQDHAKRKAQHVSTTSQKRSKMRPSATFNTGKDSAEARSQLIVRFYDPDIKAKDAKNRTLEEILSWPDSQLESSHNYIQMLFPLPEGSMFNWDAPVIDLAVMQAFCSRSELRHQLRRSFERMLKFYGFRVPTKPENESKKDVVSEVTQTDVNTNSPNNADTSASGVKATPEASTFPPGAHQNISISNPLPYRIVRAPNWPKQFQNWAGLFDHNHLRITRILRCLRVLGLQKECDAFFKALEHAFHDPETRISEKSMGFWRLAVMRPLQWAPDGQKCKWLEAWQQEQESEK